MLENMIFIGKHSKLGDLQNQPSLNCFLNKDFELIIDLSPFTLEKIPLRKIQDINHFHAKNFKVEDWNYIIEKLKHLQALDEVYWEVGTNKIKEFFAKKKNELWDFMNEHRLDKPNDPMNPIKQADQYSNDPIGFINSFVKIETVPNGIVPLDLFDSQKTIIKSILKNKFVICEMPRQYGKTTTAVSYILWSMITKKNYKVAIVVKSNSFMSSNIMGKYKLAYEYLPTVFTQLENNSSIKYISADELENGDLSSYDLIYVDEMAVVQFDKVGALNNAIAHVKFKTDAKLFIISSASDIDSDYNAFSYYWEKALESETDFVPLTFYSYHKNT